MSNEKFIVYLDDSTDLFTEHCLELKTVSTTTTPAATADNNNKTDRRQSVKRKTYYTTNDSPATQVAKFIRGLKSERIAAMRSNVDESDDETMSYTSSKQSSNGAPPVLIDDESTPCDVKPSSRRNTKYDKKCVSLQ